MFKKVLKYLFSTKNEKGTGGVLKIICSRLQRWRLSRQSPEKDFVRQPARFGKLSGLPIFQEYILLRLLFFVCMLICNSAVWTLFAKALQYTDSSLTATVISSATNYSFSALLGSLLFEETTSIFWWSGMFFIISGLLLVLSGERNENTHRKEKVN
ncbi:hypothetical protein NQ317_013575 [Molorchus minor]|uniref:EamA domain-containing protein n=1 Tax=Molorchus minor TaxID=1323400 RepID=A0ABQ9J390_9CUCU|nr:hypothetical protein NQ317_013575 [Molorchus minor]